MTIITRSALPRGQEARLGRKSPKQGFYGHKVRAVMDAGGRFITGLKTTPALALRQGRRRSSASGLNDPGRERPWKGFKPETATR